MQQIHYTHANDVILEFIQSQEDGTSIKDFTVFDLFCYVAINIEMFERTNSMLNKYGIAQILEIKKKRRKETTKHNLAKLMQEYNIGYKEINKLLGLFNPSGGQNRV